MGKEKINSHREDAADETKVRNWPQDTTILNLWAHDGTILHNGSQNKKSAIEMPSFQGADGCPCINSFDSLKEFAECKTSSGDPGVISQSTSICYPLSYGSSFCKMHDSYADPSCMGDPKTDPKYCNQSWCYVDLQKCKLSTEQAFSSDSFALDLFYSYSTCNSSAAAWLRTVDTQYFKKPTRLRATIPGSFYPFQFKTNENGTIAKYSGPEYYNNSIPFHGALIEYLDRVVDTSDDIEDITYEFRSKSSDMMYPLSSFTASVKDVQAGLTDMAVGTFWMTSERLNMTAFTSPIMIDKFFLVVKEPEVNMSFSYQVERMMNPFNTELWTLLLLTVIAVSALSLWFASPRAGNKRPWLAFRNEEWKRANFFKKIFIICRQLTEAVLQTGMYLFSAGVEQDFRASLPQKLLMFGFSFVIVISVSAYVANLAAYLTLSGVSDYIDSMEEAMAKNAKICAHPVIKEELRAVWPDAKFVFNDETPEYNGVLELYEKAECDIIAASVVDTRYDPVLMNRFCELNLVFTKGLVFEIPIAFPVKKDLAAGISHWLYNAEKRLSFSFEEIYTSYDTNIKCDVDLASKSEQRDYLEPLTPRYMIFPYFILLIFAGAGVVVKLCRRSNAMRAAKFIASVANLDESTSHAIVQLASFAHLNVEYSEDFDLDADPKKMTMEDKREYLKRISRRVSMAMPQRFHNHGDDYLYESTSCFDEWQVKNELARRISQSITSMPTMEYSRNSEMDEEPTPVRKCGDISKRIKPVSILKSSLAFPGPSPRTQSAFSFDDESLHLEDFNDSVENDEVQHSNLSHTFHSSISSALHGSFASFGSRGNRENIALLPIEEAAEVNSTGFQDEKYKEIAKHVVMESRGMIQDVVKESMLQILIEVNNGSFSPEQQMSRMDGRSKDK